jgi:hypothetical protein
MAESDGTLSISELQRSLSATLLRVTGTSEPVFVAVGERAGVAIVDLDTYRELLELADRGLTAEIVARAAQADASGDTVSGSDVKDEWQRDIERWKHEANG